MDNVMLCLIMITQSIINILVFIKLTRLEEWRNYTKLEDWNPPINDVDDLLDSDDEYITKEYEVADEHEDDVRLSINERTLLREEAFNKRIRDMQDGSVIPMTKRELDNHLYKTNVTSRAYYETPHNIPHEAVDLTLSQLPDVEETD